MNGTNMNIKIKIIFLLILSFTICPVFASGYYVVNNLDRIFAPSTQENSNAVCFFYRDGKYKCACKEPTTLKIWTSGDITRIKGFSFSKSYGNIKECSDVDFSLGL